MSKDRVYNFSIYIFLLFYDKSYIVVIGRFCKEKSYGVKDFKTSYTHCFMKKMFGIVSLTSIGIGLRMVHGMVLIHNCNKFHFLFFDKNTLKFQFFQRVGHVYMKPSSPSQPHSPSAVVKISQN